MIQDRVSIKLPIIAKGADAAVKNGVAYAYADSNSPALAYSTNNLNTGGAITYTLQQIHKNEKSSSVAYGMFNGVSLDIFMTQ